MRVRLTTSKKPSFIDTWNAAPSAGIDRTVMLRCSLIKGLEMFVRLTVRERDHPDKLGRLLADYTSNQPMQRKRDFSKLLINIYGNKNDYAL
jgi:hypothetical protein